MKSFFVDHHQPLPPKPALSEHSTSNPTSSTDHIPTVIYTAADPPATDPIDMDEDEEEEEDENENDEAESGSEDETGGRNLRTTSTAPPAEPSEVMQIEMPEDIRVGSPNDGSNNLDSDFHQLLAVSQQTAPGNASTGQGDSYRSESTRRWGPVEEPLQVQLPSSGKLVVDIS